MSALRTCLNPTFLLLQGIFVRNFSFFHLRAIRRQPGPYLGLAGQVGPIYPEICPEADDYGSRQVTISVKPRQEKILTTQWNSRTSRWQRVVGVCLTYPIYSLNNIHGRNIPLLVRLISSLGDSSKSPGNPDCWIHFSIYYLATPCYNLSQPPLLK